MNKNLLKTIGVAVIVSGIVSALVTCAVIKLHQPTQQERIKDHYASEAAVIVSPHHIRKAMLKGENDFILVDLRSQEEYEREHVIAAVNVPAYRDPEHSAYGDVERIVRGFRDLEERYPDKDIIVYCYSMPCMTGRKIGNMLAQHGVYVKELGIGWNEWRHFWTLWNHEHEWGATKPEDYVTSGAEPGAFALPEGGEAPEPCGVDNEFGC